MISISAPTAATLEFCTCMSTGIAFFKFRIRPTAGTKAIGAADHHQARAQLLDILHQHVHLLVGELRQFVHCVAGGASDVRENHAIVVLQLGERAKECIRRLHRHFEFVLAQHVLPSHRTRLDVSELTTSNTRPRPCRCVNELAMLFCE